MKKIYMVQSRWSALRAIIAMVIALSLCVQTVVAAGGKEKGRERKQKVVDENGVEYDVTINIVDPDSFVLEYVNKQSHAKTSIIFSQGKAIITEYTFVGKSIFGAEKYKKNKEEKQDFSGMMKRAKEQVVSSAGYGAYRYMTIAYKSDGKEYFHYYRIGTSSPDIGYVEIGCVRGYRLKNDATYFNEYKQKVDENIRETDLAGCTTAVAALAFVILVLSPSKAVAAVAIAQLGIDATAIYHLVKAHAAYKEADSYFDMAKAYGTRVY